MSNYVSLWQASISSGTPLLLNYKTPFTLAQSLLNCVSDEPTLTLINNRFERVWLLSVDENSELGATAHSLLNAAAMLVSGANADMCSTGLRFTSFRSKASVKPSIGFVSATSCDALPRRQLHAQLQRLEDILLDIEQNWEEFVSNDGEKSFISKFPPLISKDLFPHVADNYTEVLFDHLLKQYLGKDNVRLCKIARDGKEEIAVEVDSDAMLKILSQREIRNISLN